MLMVVESPAAADLFVTSLPRRNAAERVLVAARFGETYRFDAGRHAVEIVFGFRPGVDRIVVVAEENAPRGGRALASEEAGHAAVIDGRGRRIVLLGVALSDLKAGDIEIEWAA